MASAFWIIMLTTLSLWLAEALFVGGLRGLWRKLMDADPDPATAETWEAFKRATKRFHEIHGDAYGSRDYTFIVRNQEKLTRSTFAGGQLPQPSDLDGRGYRNAPTAPIGVREEFLELFMSEVLASPGRELDVALTTQQLAADAKGGRSDVQEWAAFAEEIFKHIASQLDATLEAQGAKGREVAAELRGDLKRAVEAYNDLRLHRTLAALDAVVTRLDGYREFNPVLEGDLVVVRQLSLAMKAEVFHLMGRLEERNALVAALKGGGPIMAGAVRSAALIAANVGDAGWLADLLPRLPADDERRLFLSAALGWLNHDVEEVLSATAGANEPDLLALRVQALIRAPTPERAVEAASLIDRLDEPWPDVTPRKNIVVATLTFGLLRSFLQECVLTPGFDRIKLVRQVRSRYNEAIRVLREQEIASEYPGGLMEALVGKAMFLEFVGEFSAADAVASEVKSVRERHSVAAEAVLFELDEAATPDVIKQLEASGEMSARLQIPRALAALRADKLSEAESHFRLAWAEASTPFDAERALIHLVRFLVAKRDPDAARSFLDGEIPSGSSHPLVRPDEVAVHRAFVTCAKHGRTAALDEVERALPAHPRSLPLLRFQVRLLEEQLTEEKRRLEVNPVLSGGPKFRAAAALDTAAADLYAVLPAPSYKVTQAKTWAERGDQNRARALMREALEEGAEGFGPNGQPL